MHRSFFEKSAKKSLVQSGKKNIFLIENIKKKILYIEHEVFHHAGKKVLISILDCYLILHVLRQNLHLI